MDVKFKKLDKNAVLPSYANPGDAGLDLTAIRAERANGYIEYYTGLSIEIPDGFVGLIFPRSSISKKQQILSNSVGVIDSGYRGEIKFRFKSLGTLDGKQIYSPGDKIGQLVIMPFPKVTVVESNELSDTQRNLGGFGSSDGNPS